jgi:CubicO group peptidase (beta-lactamase class C family)
MTQFKRIPQAFLNRLSSMMEIANVPGLSIAMIQDGEVSWTKDFGVQESGKNEAITAQTVYSVGSLSKPVFADGVMRLVEAGKLDLDQPLAGKLEEDYIPDQPLAAAITARHVLSHTSGLQNWRFNKSDRLEVKFPPGEQFSYSGEGIFYLQRVVEKLSGQPFEVFMRSQVFQPLGMQTSSYLWRADFAKRIAWGHVENKRAVEPWAAQLGKQMLEIAARTKLPLEQWSYADVLRALPEMNPLLDALPYNKSPNAATSLLTTATEFAGFMAHVLRGGSHQVQLSPQIQLNPTLSWGLGWGLETVGKSTCIWHWGDTGIAQCFVMGSVETQSGMVVLTNSDRGLKVCQPLFNESLGRECYPFLWL